MVKAHINRIATAVSRCYAVRRRPCVLLRRSRVGWLMLGAHTGTRSYSNDLSNERKRDGWVQDGISNIAQGNAERRKAADKAN